MMDPLKLRKFLLIILRVLIVIELINAMTQGMQGNGWGRFGLDLVLAGVLYLTWERLKAGLQSQKHASREKLEQRAQEIKLWDALVFSLLWTDEIYRGIPPDRLRLVTMSYTLIALGVLVAFVKPGTGIMPLVIAGALVLAAINLVSWVVSSEREAKEELATELRLAHNVQVSLMPSADPEIPGIQVAGRSIPAREVGGDHFDYACAGPEHRNFCVSVFDVSGKGMQAAMTAVFTSGAYAGEVKQGESPARILTNLNAAVHARSQRGHFVAFLLASLNLDSQLVTYANAGQTRPLLRSNGSVQWLHANGPTFPLGMQPQTSYADASVQLHAGDVLFLMTDGFTEAMNGQEEQFGGERIEAVVKSLDPVTQSPSQMIAALTDATARHVGTAQQHDDMTIVVVKVV